MSTGFIAQAVAEYRGLVFGRWPDLNMTYAFDQSCQLPYRRAAIDVGLQAWQRWLPESSWSETSLDSARLRIRCYDSNTLPNAPGVVASVLSYPLGSFNVTSWLYTFLYADVEFGNYTWRSGNLIVTHEFGHAFGLIDGTGGLMNQNDWQTAPYDPIIGIPVPTQQQMDALAEVYGVAPHTLNAITRTTGIQIQSFTIWISQEPKWGFKIAYYAVAGSTELVLIIPGGRLIGSSYSSYIYVNDTGPTDFASHLANNYRFDVAIIQAGSFVTSTPYEINSIITQLANLYGSKQVFLIGHSGGGAVVASYVTSHPNNTLVQGAVVLDAPLAASNSSETVNWNFNGLPNAAYRAENLTIPTLLIYGENDTVTPSHRNGGAWLDHAPENMANVELYSYGHNPWSNETSPTVRTEVEERIIQYMLHPVPIPEMPHPILIISSLFLMLVLISKPQSSKRLKHEHYYS